MNKLIRKLIAIEDYFNKQDMPDVRETVRETIDRIQDLESAITKKQNYISDLQNEIQDFIDRG